MESRDPRKPPSTPTKHTSKHGMTQQDLGRPSNIRRRLFVSPEGHQNSSMNMEIDSPEIPPIVDALDEAQSHYSFNFRTGNPIAGGAWDWETFSGALLRAEESPCTSSSMGSPLITSTPIQPRPRTGESSTSARRARVRSSPRPRLSMYPIRRRGGRRPYRSSTARSFATGAPPVPDPHGPRAPTGRGWGRLSSDVTPPMHSHRSPSWVFTQRPEGYEPRNCEYEPKN